MRKFKGTFRTPTPEDIIFVARNMREADRRELKRWTGCNEKWGLVNSIRQSEVCYTGLFEDGKIGCIFGATRFNLMEDDAILWALSTNEVDKHKMEFALGSKAGLDKIFRELPDVGEFRNWMDLDYAAAVRWIEWLGASFSIRGRILGRWGSQFGEFIVLNPYYKKEEE